MFKKMTALIIFILMFSLRVIAPEHKQLYILKTKEESIQLTWSNIDWWLNYYQVESIPIVKSQIWLETGNLTSKFCRENNNLCGMKLPTRRNTTALGKLDGMAYYPDWIHSVEDYRLWQQYFYHGGNYYEFLHSRGYAEDRLYIQKLKNYLVKM